MNRCPVGDIAVDIDWRERELAVAKSTDALRPHDDRNEHAGKNAARADEHTSIGAL